MIVTTSGSKVESIKIIQHTYLKISIMKRVLSYFSVLFSLSGSVLLLSSCLSGNLEELAPSLAGTAWEYLERENSQGVERELATVITFSEESYSIVEVYRENREILSIQSVTGPYEFDGRRIVCRTDPKKRTYVEYEMDISHTGDRLVWEIDGYTMVFSKR
jgi:hypothetical protein